MQATEMRTGDESAPTHDKSDRWTSAIQQAYERDGFVLLRGLYDQAELELLRSAAARSTGGKPGVRKGLEKHDEFFAIELSSGGHLGLMRQLAGERLIGATAGYFDKEVGASSTVEPHRDGGGTMGGATIWVALDDADVSNGCLHYTPGSHLAFEPPKYAYAAPPEGRTGGIPVEARAGDAIIHDAKVVHFSERATEPRRRRALTFFYRSEDAAKT